MKNMEKNVAKMMVGLLLGMLAIYTGALNGAMHLVHNVLIGATLMTIVIAVYEMSVASKIERE